MLSRAITKTESRLSSTWQACKHSATVFFPNCEMLVQYGTNNCYKTYWSSCRPEEQYNHSHGSLFGTVKDWVTAGKLWQLGTFSISSRLQMSPPKTSPSLPVCFLVCCLYSHVWAKNWRSWLPVVNLLFCQLLLYPRCSQPCVK